MENFTPMQLLRALVGHVDSLEVLHMDLDNGGGEFGWFFQNVEELRLNDALQRFSKLRELHATFSNLFGVRAERPEESNSL